MYTFQSLLAQQWFPAPKFEVELGQKKLASDPDIFSFFTEKLFSSSKNTSCILLKIVFSRKKKFLGIPYDIRAAHAIALVRNLPCLYVFDPNFGMFEVSGDTGFKAILKRLFEIYGVEECYSVYIS